MRLITNTPFERENVVTAAEAVAHVAERARTQALEGMLGRLIGVLIDNGQLRTDQVDAIFDYDVSAEA